jgi:hypothetical protein
MTALRKNGHLFLSIFENLDGEFYFYLRKISFTWRCFEYEKYYFVMTA